ncbi:MAG TPA: mechanosensitive ion channel domain-containing protein [Gaiellaceae bacterium]
MLWHRIVTAAVVFAITLAVAWVVDRRLAHRPLAPEAATRYRVLRRSVMTSVLVVGFFSALLTVPPVRAVAGGILASSAVVGIVVGFASQRTLGNFVAGLLIALSQPLRLGDKVQVQNTWGVVEEIGLSYTFIRTPDGSRLVIPNEKLASDSIVNASIRNRSQHAEITVQVPLGKDLRQAIDVVKREVPDGEVFVSGLDGSATLTVRSLAKDEPSAELLERELRLRAAEALRTAGVIGA